MTARNLSPKQLNFARISIVCVDIIKLPLEDILNIFIKPTELVKNINACQSLLNGKFKLNPDQETKCCLNSTNLPDYSKFDVSLLYKLIRNLCPDPSLGSTSKWGITPTKNDVCVVDDIERIRELRNASFAHTKSAEISDDDFKKFWHDAKCIISRCQQFTTSKGCNKDYNQILINLERRTLTFEEYISRREPSGAIYILGDTDIRCGETACFKAAIALDQDVHMPVSWDRVDGSSRKQLDIKSDKYEGSSSTQLIIHRVCKDDEAVYQAVISRNQDVKIFSNEVYLRAMGERPYLEELNVTAKNEDLSIHYVLKAHSPDVNKIVWTKNALMLDLSSDKYRGGRLADKYITISNPSEEDKGEYTCKVSNAVGFDSKNVKLDIPSVEIPFNRKVIFGSETRFDCYVSGNPPADKVEWQNSLDGTMFYPIDIYKDEYSGSSSDPRSPFLLVRSATLNDQQYYRVVVSNVIGKCTSNILFLQVAGNRPNIAAETCTLLDRSVRLKCDVFLYDESPPLNDVYWTKNGIKLDIARKDGKYSGVDDPSLIINSVNYKDAGDYQLTAVNAVGETKSEELVLGVPAVRLKKIDNKEDGSLLFTMEIKSLPVPHFVQWNIKENSLETFKPINVNAAEYNGTSSSFPHPVLVIQHRNKLKNCSFEIEVHNLIGKVNEMIPGEINQDNLKREQHTVGKFYDDGGSRLPFCILLDELAQGFPREIIYRLKYLIQISCNIKDVAELEKAKTAEDCFLILQKEKIVTPSDVIAMQFLLQRTNCKELEKKCIEYAKKRKAIYYYEKPPENGYRNVRFHVVANLHSFSSEDETKITETVANIIGCSTKDIQVNGYLHSTSFFIVLSINEIYIERLFTMKQHDKDKLSKLNIDFFKDDFKTITLERTTDHFVQKRMFLPNYKSTRGTTNLARVERMILGPCTDVLCALLTKEVTPSALMHNVKAFIANYPKHRPCPINKEQEKLVYGGYYSKFDITLLYALLRNVSTIPPHLNNWGNEPNQNDRSVSANIERIRLLRNMYGYSSDTSLTDTTFNAKCQTIFTIIQELEGYLGADTIFQDAVAHMKTCSMDPEQEAKFINQIQGVNIKLAEEIHKTRSSTVHYRLRVLYERTISKWKEDDSVFLETHNFPVMLKQVRKQPYVTFVGVPGSGKTATVRHIALILQKEGYEILPIVDINRIEDYSNSLIPQVFVIDDVLGLFGLNNLQLSMIYKYSEILTNPVNPKTKILMTCREAVYRNEMLLDCILMRKNNVVHLQSKENALNDEDKQNLLENFKLQRELLTSGNLASSSNMFPFLCKLYSGKKELQVYGPTFFITPVPCIIDEMNSLQMRYKHHYAALVLLMANENKLSEKMLTNENKETIGKKKNELFFDEMKGTILRECRVSSNTNLIDALLEMEGTYTKRCDNEFTFIHDILFEIIAYHFGRQFPELILKYASSNYIANYIKIDKESSKKRKRIECDEDKACENDKLMEQKQESEKILELCITLHERQYPVLAERLFQDVQNGEFYNVFGNEALKNPSMLQNFIAVLDKKSYNNLYNILLSELKTSEEIAKWKYESVKLDVEVEKYLSLRTHTYLIDERFIENRYRRSIRGIAWVVFFGHYPILQYLLNRMKQEKGKVDDLFRNCFNERRQSYANTNQDDTGTVVESLLNHCMIDQLDKKPDNVKEDNIPFIDTDNDAGNCTISDTDIDAERFTIDDSDIGPFNEPVILEQCRLLCLACYSGDLNTVQILLKHVKNDALNNTLWPTQCLYLKNNPLIIACENGYLDVAKELLEAGSDINICVNFNTPLTVACENGQHSIVRQLLNSGACLNKHCLHTALQCACEMEHIILVEELINARADVNINTPLVVACTKGNIRIVEKLIKAGADVNLACENENFCVQGRLRTGNFFKVTIKDKTPLMAACDGGHFNIIKLLIKSGANPGDKYKTAIHFPWYWEHLNIVKMLIKMESTVYLNEANEPSLISACDLGQLGVVKEMVKGGTDVNMTDGDKTPLIVACYKEHMHVVNELIKAGADVNLSNYFFSPLEVACYEGHSKIVKTLFNAGCNDSPNNSTGKALIAACFFGHLCVVKELIACHVDVNIKYEKETPLTTASYMGFLNIVKELIEAGADVNINDRDKTPLTAACYRRNINIVEELIKEKADVNQSDGNKTPLTAACNQDDYIFVRDFINAGADVNQSDGKHTPLTVACEQGYLGLVEELIKSNAHVNQSDGYKTPLIAACETGHCDIVQMLIEACADVNQSDGNKTPLIAACETGHSGLVQILIEAGADANKSDGNKTPLVAACEKEQWDIVQMLREAGADVNQSGSETKHH